MSTWQGKSKGKRLTRLLLLEFLPLLVAKDVLSSYAIASN
jgi:hypothetical protein